MRILIFIVLLHICRAINISKILNYTYQPSDGVKILFNGSTCDACLCEAFTHYNSTISAVNCFSSGQRCEIFLNYSTNYTMIHDQNGIFYFYPEPPPISNDTGNVSTA